MAHCILQTADCSAQAPEIEWQNTIGTNADDEIWSCIPTSDGGYFLGGHSTGDISFDKSEDAIGHFDYWVVKLNSSGDIVWQNTIGGTGPDYLWFTQQTLDSGFILCGYSGSGISGDKTELSNGGDDFWIIKLNSSGELEWQNTIGGDYLDIALSIDQSSDGGYILGGYTGSDISGDKTENGFGDWDYWVLKIDSIGNIEWQKTLGGSNNDILFSVLQTFSGEYLVGGYSSSGITGNKTVASKGSNDYWIIKLSIYGDILWQKSIGGSSNDELKILKQSADGGFLLGGSSYSGISGDKTEVSRGSWDFWIVKMDEAGTIEWDKTIGGSTIDYLNSMDLTFDGNFILGGYSNSSISGDKTEASFGGPVFGADYWAVKLAETGEILWQKVVGGSGDDLLFAIHATADYGYFLGGWSNSGVSGNKNEINLGAKDYWVIKLFSDCLPAFEICNSIDDNCNGIIDEDVTETINISAAGPTSFCNGGSVILNAIHTGVTVQWKKNGINIPAATLSAYTASSKGYYLCESYSSCDTVISSVIYINILKGPSASITAGGLTEFCAGGSVTLTANTGILLSYQWYNGFSIIAGATSINYTATEEGNYKCKVTKAFTGCAKLSNTIMVNVPCKENIGELNPDNIALLIFPNPATDKLFITINRQSINPSYLTLTDISGKIISTFLITAPSIEIDISQHASGMYFIKAEINGTNCIQKFIKE